MNIKSSCTAICDFASDIKRGQQQQQQFSSSKFGGILEWDGYGCFVRMERCINANWSGAQAHFVKKQWQLQWGLEPCAVNHTIINNIKLYKNELTDAHYLRQESVCDLFTYASTSII